jgi:hypothetical protein
MEWLNLNQLFYLDSVCRVDKMTTLILKAISYYTAGCYEKLVAWLKSHGVLELNLAIGFKNIGFFLIVRQLTQKIIWILTFVFVFLKKNTFGTVFYNYF